VNRELGGICEDQSCCYRDTDKKCTEELRENLFRVTSVPDEIQTWHFPNIIIEYYHYSDTLQEPDTDRYILSSTQFTLQIFSMCQV
jgi:hypothetical protein